MAELSGQIPAELLAAIQKMAIDEYLERASKPHKTLQDIENKWKRLLEGDWNHGKK